MAKTVKVEIKDDEAITGFTFPLHPLVDKHSLIQRFTTDVKLVNAMAKLKEIANA